MADAPILQHSTLSLVTNAQRDSERLAEHAARLVAPYAAMLAHVQETNRRMTSLLVPFLESMTHFHRTMGQVAGYQSRADATITATKTSVAIPSEQQWFIAPIHRQDFEVVESKKAVVELPPDTRWEDIELRFKDAHTLSVLLKGKHVCDCDFADLGLARTNTSEPTPNKQWKFLQQLSVIVEQKNIVLPTTENLFRSLRTTRAALHKNKQALSERLISSFGITDSPFHPYDQHHGYRLRCMLRPEPVLRGGGELHSSGGRLIENIIYEDE